MWKKGILVASSVATALALFAWFYRPRIDSRELYDRGKYYVEAAEPEKAIDYLERALEADSRWLLRRKVHENLCLAVLGLGRDGSSIFRRALVEFPNSPRLNLLDLVFRISAADSRLSDQAARDLMMFWPYLVESDVELIGSAFNNAGAGCFRNGNSKRAIEMFRRVLTWEPDRVESKRNLAAVLGTLDIHVYQNIVEGYSQDERDELLAVVRNILGDELLGVSSSMYTNMGIQLQQLGRIEESSEAYRHALRKQRDNIVACNNLGWNLYMQTRYEEAVIKFRQAIEIVPNSAASFNLGLSYLAMGSFAKAESTYTEAITIYGIDEAQRISAAEDVRALTEKEINIAEVEKILRLFGR